MFFWGCFVVCVFLSFIPNDMFLFCSFLISANFPHQTPSHQKADQTDCCVLYFFFFFGRFVYDVSVFFFFFQLTSVSFRGYCCCTFHFFVRVFFFQQTFSPIDCFSYTRCHFGYCCNFQIRFSFFGVFFFCLEMFLRRQYSCVYACVCVRA